MITSHERQDGLSNELSWMLSLAVHSAQSGCCMLTVAKLPVNADSAECREGGATQQSRLAVLAGAGSLTPRDPASVQARSQTRPRTTGSGPADMRIHHGAAREVPSRRPTASSMLHAMPGIPAERGSRNAPRRSLSLVVSGGHLEPYCDTNTLPPPPPPLPNLLPACFFMTSHADSPSLHSWCQTGIVASGCLPAPLPA